MGEGQGSQTAGWSGIVDKLVMVLDREPLRCWTLQSKPDGSRSEGRMGQPRRKVEVCAVQRQVWWVWLRGLGGKLWFALLTEESLNQK